MDHSDRPHRRGRVAGVLVNAACAAAVALAVVVALGPHTGRIQFFTVLTSSMDPSIPAGSVVAVTPVDPAGLKVGDVITYRIPVQDRRVVTHRVVSVEGGRGGPTVRTQGDATEEPDAWTTRFADGPVWKVRAHAAGAGYALRAVQRPAVRTAMVVVVPALLALYSLARIWGLGPGRSAAGVAPSSSLIVIRPRSRWRRGAPAGQGQAAA